ILIFNTLYSPLKVGGAELSVQSLAEGFVNRGQRVGVVTLGEQDEEYDLNGVRVWRLKLENIFWPFINKERNGFQRLKWHINDMYNSSYYLAVNKIIEDFSPDIVYTNNLAGFSVSIWDIAKKHNLRIVHT